MTRLLGIGLLAILWLASLSIVACGGWAEAEKIGAAAVGAVEVAIDADPTGNTASTLGTVEECVRVDVAPANFGDGVADVTIDVVVQGDTQAPIIYDAYLIYVPTDVDPVSWADLDKMAPSAATFTTKAPPQLNCGAVDFSATAGTAGDGYLVRINLDVISAGVTGFSLTGPGGNPAYASALGAHPTTKGGAFLAINQDCPAVLPFPSPTPTPPTLTPMPTPTPPTLTPVPTPTPPTLTPMPTPPPGTILLVGGWNNSCYVGSEQPIEDALADIADHVLAVYRMSSDQGFDRWFPNRPEVSTIASVSPYQPLFILMDQYAFWPREPSGTPPTSVSLVSGWNSVCYTGQTKSVGDATAGVAGGFGIMYQLGSDQGWSRYVPARPEVSNIVQLSQYDTVLMLVHQEGGTIWAFDP